MPPNDILNSRLFICLIYIVSPSIFYLFWFYFILFDFISVVLDCVILSGKRWLFLLLFFSFFFFFITGDPGNPPPVLLLSSSPPPPPSTITPLMRSGAGCEGARRLMDVMTALQLFTARVNVVTGCFQVTAAGRDHLHFRSEWFTAFL